MRQISKKLEIFRSHGNSGLIIIEVNQQKRLKDLMPKNLMIKSILAAVFCMLICIGQSLAQSSVAGGINGKVSDPQGALGPNAKVTIVNLGTTASSR